MFHKKRIGTLAAAAFGLLSVIYFCIAIVSAAAPGRSSNLFQMPPEEDWQVPINLSQSGSGTAPQLLALYNGYLVFWRDQDGLLFYSNVPATAFGDFTAWRERRQVAEAVVKAAAIVDVYGRIHVSCFRSQDDVDHPAGFYYQHSNDGGES